MCRRCNQLRRYSPPMSFLSRNVLATLWRDKLHETFHSVTYPATAKIVGRQLATAVAETRIKFYLSCNDFGRCRVCDTVKCFVQLVPRQVARNISQCNSVLNNRNRCKNLSKKLNEVEDRQNVLVQEYARFENVSAWEMFLLKFLTRMRISEPLNDEPTLTSLFKSSANQATFIRGSTGVFHVFLSS